MHEDGVFDRELDDIPEKRGVLFEHVLEAGVVGVRGGVVWHEEVEEHEDDVLQGEGDPIDVAPTDEASDDSGEEAGEKHTE